MSCGPYLGAVAKKAQRRALILQSWDSFKAKTWLKDLKLSDLIDGGGHISGVV